jgi:hypothetical protein
MGAWGAGVFENDTAGDWTDQFEQDAPPSIIAAALADVERSVDPDADACSVALAAAEVIAASRGHAVRGVPEEIKEWLAKTRFQADDELSRRAGESIVRIAESSELRELWENAAVWRRGLENLRRRLEQPAKPLRYRISKVGRNVGIRAARKAISEMGGYLLVQREGPAYLELPDDLSDPQLIDILQNHSEALAKVYSLVIKSRKITDRSLAEFYRLSHLVALYLDRTSISDAGLPHLVKMAGLLDLSLATTSVSDEGLLALVGSGLRCLAVQNTRITPAGVERFRREMPNCFVGPSWEWQQARR